MDEMDKYEFNKGYYHFAEDLIRFPDAWCYVVWSARTAGKTYSALWYALANNIKIAYMKRTNDDVKLICNENKIGLDASPYYPINRDHNTDVRAKLIDKGIGGFYIEGETSPISYVLSLNASKALKGFDLSVCDWFVFDEFIPQPGEIVKRKEGEMVLSLYMTLRRDREKRGRDPLRLILFANAESISTPVTNTLEIVDTMADMNITGEEFNYDEERGILLHRIKSSCADYENSGIYKAMKDTAWGRVAFGGEFANNDFSCVRKMSIKGMRPLIELHYKMKNYYIYQRSDGIYYMCSSRGKCVRSYDLNRELEQRNFYRKDGFDLVNRAIRGNMFFQSYSMYDLIANYKRYFDIT